MWSIIRLFLTISRNRFFVAFEVVVTEGVIVTGPIISVLVIRFAFITAATGAGVTAATAAVAAAAAAAAAALL